MKKIFCSLLFLILIFLGCSQPVKNLDSQGKNIICFGDSITKGVGAKEGESYPEVLEGMAGRKIINAGLSGDTTTSALKRLGRDVLDKDPFLVIVELGGNDFLRDIPREVTFRNLEKIILKIQEKGAAVALCDISSSFILSGYRNDFKKLAQKTGALLIPRLLEEILDDPSLKSDYIHPNKKGYVLIAQRVYEVIRRYFDF